MDSIPAFLKHKAPEIDPAWSNVALASAITKNAAIHSEPPRAASTEVKTRTTQFKGFIQACTRKSTDHEIRKFNIASQHTWEEVRAEADRAVDAYNKKASSWRRNPFRLAGRVMGDKGPVIQTWLELLPVGEYTSIVCGALKLVFGAAARMADIRQRILDTFASLPASIEASEDYLKIYRQDGELVSKAEDLYLAVLDGIQGMMAWIDHKAYKEVFKVFFMQESYAKSLDEKITVGIQEKSRLFADRARVCLHLRAEKIQSTVDRVEDGMSRVEGGLGRVEEASNKNTDLFDSINNLLVGIVKDAEWRWKYQSQLMMLQLAEARKPVVIVQSIVSPEQLEEILMVDYESISRDVHLSIKYGQMMNLRQQQRAAWVMQEPRFQQWFKTSGSQILVVESMEVESGPTSTLSYLCAMLQQSLENLQIAVPLSFFCGWHATPGDNLEGASGIMRSLITQILIHSQNQSNRNRWPPFDCSFINLGFLDQIRTFDISHLCLLLRNLLTSATSTTIFCLVDGISAYDTSRRSADVAIMMSYLRDLVQETNQADSGIDFKLLLTTPRACPSAGVWFPYLPRIVMPDETGGNGEAFNELSMAAKTRGILGS